MTPNQKSDTKQPLFGENNSLLLYSLYLAIGSVAFFISVNLGYTAYQGYIWSYTTKYVINSLATALILLIASGLFLMGCYTLVKGKRFTKLLGTIGCVLLIVFPIYVLFIDTYVPYAFHYVLLLWIPAFVVLFIVVYVWYTKRITD